MSEPLPPVSLAVDRAWGTVRVLDSGPRHCVKELLVLPGRQISLQRHLHRAEHWVVASGTALVTAGEVVAILTENESIDIPIGTVHRLANPGHIPLVVVEVQVGSYLGEDDILRHDMTLEVDRAAIP